MQQTFKLPESQVVLCFGSQHPVVQLPASFCLQYFPREDTEAGAPIKVTISIGANEWREFSFTMPQARKMLYFLRKVTTRRKLLPEAASD